MMVVLLWLFASCAGEGTATDDPQGVPVASATVALRDLSSRREVTAPVVAYQRVYITAQTAGQVLSVGFEEGDVLRKGDLLVQLDTRRQEAQLQRAEATLREVRQNHRRQKQLFETGIIPLAEYEAIQRQLEEAMAEVAFWLVEVDLGKILSPIDAVVTDKLIEMGTHVSQNQRLFTIEDHQLLVVRPGVSEKDVVHLKKGQQVDLSFDVFPDELFTGTIRRIFPAANTITRLFTVEVEIDQTATTRKLYPGYLARVHFFTGSREAVPAIPPEALFEDDETLVVFVIQDNVVSRRVIETGVRRDGWIEILSGLQGGEMVAAGNLEALEDNAAVIVRGEFRRYGFRN